MKSRFVLLLLPTMLWMGVASALDLAATDADNKPVTFNERGCISVIISSNQNTQKQTRETGQLLDEFQGQKDYREMVLVNLKDSLGNMVPAFVRMQMRQNLDIEAKRITPFFLANGNHENPRLYTRAVADFDGKLSTAVGWNTPEPVVKVVVYDRNGNPSFRWTASESPASLKEAIKNLLAKS